MITTVSTKPAFVLVLVACLVGCQIGGSPVSKREGYFTWVDEQGRVRYSPIVESPPTPPKPDSPDTRADAEADAVAQPADADAQGPALAEDTEYTLENYPDAEQLEKDGYIRPGEPQPYFTWRDAEGNVRVSYYQPDTRSEQARRGPEPPIRITEASVYHRDPEASAAQPVPGQDPDAFDILGIEEPAGRFFDRFARSCCAGLDPDQPLQWQAGREFGMTIDDGAPTHAFSTGRSPYQLVRLPPPEQAPAFVIHLRSYARDGVFLPSLVFLDQNMTPVRLVTDLVMTFTPENWHRRGYLEAWVPAFPSEGERWLVLFTRAEDLRDQTVVELSSGPKRVPHVAAGEIGLRQIEE